MTWRETWRKFKKAVGEAVGFPAEHDHGELDDVAVPNTIPPSLVELVFWNGLMVLGIWLALAAALSWFTWDGPIIAAFAMPFILGLLLDTYMVNIPDWYGLILFNSFTNRRRVVFGGLHFKTWAETKESKLRGLKREVTATIESVISTKNPYQKMRVKLLVHAKFDSRRKPAQEDADNFIRFNAVEDEDLKHILESEILQMFVAYYGTKPISRLRRADVVVRAVTEEHDANHKKLHFLEKNYGVHIGVAMEVNTPDEKTTQMMSTGAAAEALAEGINILKTRAGMEQERAERGALIVDPNTDYKAGDFNFTVKGLENAKTISVVAAPGMFPGGGGGANNTKKSGGGKK